MRQLRGVDFSTYGRAFGLLARFPQVALWPLLAGVVSYLVLSSIPGGGGGGGLFDSFSAGIYGLLGQLVSSFGLALALIGADMAWRRNRVDLAETWQTGTRKIGDVFFAAIGFNFVIYLATLIGGFLGAFGAFALGLVAIYFFLYTLPAATIGGIPGSAALNASLEWARENPAPTAVVTILFIFIFNYAPTLALRALFPLMETSAFFANPAVASFIVVVIKAILDTYLAFVLAKTYSDVAFGRRRW